MSEQLSFQITVFLLLMFHVYMELTLIAHAHLELIVLMFHVYMELILIAHAHPELIALMFHVYMELILIAHAHQELIVHTNLAYMEEILAAHAHPESIALHLNVLVHIAAARKEKTAIHPVTKNSLKTMNVKNGNRSTKVF